MAEKSKNKYKPTKFLEENRKFFAGWSFNFYNLESDIVEDLTRAITDLGGTVSKDAKYTLADEKCALFYKGKKQLYCVSFLSNSLLDRKIDDIEKYRISCDEQTDSSSSHENNKENHISENDNNEDISDSEQNCNENHKARKRRAPNPYSTAKTKIKEKNLEPTVQKLRSVEIRESNKTKMSENEKIYSCSDEITEDSSSSSTIENFNACSDKKVNSNSNLTIQTEEIPITKKPKIEASTSDNESIMNTNESSSNDNKKKIAKNSKSKFSGWIDPDSILEFSSKVKSVESSSKDLSDSEVSVEEEDENEEEKDKKPIYLLNWWEKHPIPKNERCKIKSCSYESEAHVKHEWHQKYFTEFEKKIVIKYLVTHNLIDQAKGIRVWENMIQHGYLTHRTPESLRNCIRRTILPNITDFNLPTEILDQFLEIDVKLQKGHGRKQA